MARPAIISIDDDRTVLNAVERDLRQKYGRDYRVLSADSGAAGLDLCQKLLARGETVALFVVDQRMPAMEGVDFLKQAITIFPDAKKVLLTAYADTEAAISAINSVGLDYYLMKPWQPPDENLYPVLDGLLEEWSANVHPSFDGIRILGAMWSPQCHEVKDFLARHSIPYLWLDIDTDSQACELLEAASPGQSSLPVLLFPEGDSLIQPTIEQLASRVGLSVKAAQPLYDVVIIGGGPAGLSAAVTGSADGLKTLLIERRTPGGQAGNSPKIENFLGFPSGVSGGDLTRRALTQARRFGTEIVSARSATSIRAEGNTRIVTLDDGTEISAKVVLISTGAWFRTMEMPGADRWKGAGVYYGAAHTEAALFRDREVVVVGAANSAAQGMLFLSKYASCVNVIIRGDEPTWSRYLDVAIRADPKIKLHLNSEISAIDGETGIESVTVHNRKTNEQWTMPAAAVFIFIGQKPQSDFVADLIERNERGHILTGIDLMHGGKRPKGWSLERDPLMLETSVPGVFAAGDVRNGIKHGVAAATGEGNAAVSLFWQYLSTI